MRFWTMLFPSRCLYCNEVVKLDNPVCDKCAYGFVLRPYIQELSNGCLCVSAFFHKGIHRNEIIDFKFNHRKYYYKNFAAIINMIVKETWENVTFDYYTFVPTHKDKIKNRGYDQTKLIALTAADLNYCKGKKLIVQIKTNKSQKQLSAKERIKNVKDIYRISKNCDITGKTILIIDDVVTTGSTLCECANILLENGAKAVYCATVTCSCYKNKNATD